MTVCGIKRFSCLVSVLVSDVYLFSSGHILSLLRMLLNLKKGIMRSKPKSIVFSKDSEVLHIVGEFQKHVCFLPALCPSHPPHRLKNWKAHWGPRKKAMPLVKAKRLKLQRNGRRSQIRSTVPWRCNCLMYLRVFSSMRVGKQRKINTPHLLRPFTLQILCLLWRDELRARVIPKGEQYLH